MHTIKTPGIEPGEKSSGVLLSALTVRQIRPTDLVKVVQGGAYQGTCRSEGYQQRGRDAGGE
jgi:hypothetical protein